MPQTMRAPVFTDVRGIHIEEVPIPRCGPTDAIVKVTTTTICGTGSHIWRGEFPVAPGRVVGHEPAGVIHELGESVRRPAARQLDGRGAGRVLPRALRPGQPGADPRRAVRRGGPLRHRHRHDGDLRGGDRENCLRAVRPTGMVSSPGVYGDKVTIPLEPFIYGIDDIEDACSLFSDQEDGVITVTVTPSASRLRGLTAPSARLAGAFPPVRAPRCRAAVARSGRRTPCRRGRAGCGPPPSRRRS